jgi:hypothetical protein
MLRIIILLLLPGLSMASTVEDVLIASPEKELRRYPLHHNVAPLARKSQGDDLLTAAMELLKSRGTVRNTASKFDVAALCGLPGLIP